MQSHQVTSIVEQDNAINQQSGQIIPRSKIFNKNNDKSPILSSEFEFLNPLIKSSSKKHKLKRTVSDFGKISTENVVSRANDHQKKSVKLSNSLSKVAQLHHNKTLSDEKVTDDEISPLLTDTKPNNLTIKVITDDKNVLLYSKKSVPLSDNLCSSNNNNNISDIDKENLVKYQKRQHLKLPLNGTYNNNRSDRSDDTSETGPSGTEKQKNNWRHSWYAPIYGVLEEETETIKESSSLHNLAGVKNKQHLNGSHESASLLDSHHHQNTQLSAHHHAASRIPRTNTVCIVPSGQQHQAPSAHTTSTPPESAPIPRKRKFEQFLKNLVGRRPSKEPPSPPLISSPEIKVSKCPSEHNLSRLSRSKLNVSTTSLNSVHQKLWSVVPLLRKNGSCSSLHAPKRAAPFGGVDYIGLRKCETVLALTNSTYRDTGSSNGSSDGPIRPLNRLRNCGSVATCSRCSSLLSLAAGSKYSLNLSGGGFIPVNSCNNSSNAILSSTSQQQILISSVVPESPTFTVIGTTGSTYLTQLSTSSSKTVCKLCLGEYKSDNMTKISQCGCSFCTECMTAYVEFEITEGAYEVSCPDAMCPAQGVISIAEITALAAPSLVEKHHRYRLNREVELDKFRTWCPKAGCETICLVGPTSVERLVTLQSTSSSIVQAPCAVHCPTCREDFCSGCKKPWHPTMSCEENTKQLGKNEVLGIPFDNDLIKCCPMCSVPIEKDEGCAQMMCKRCKHVFCWYCLASLDDDFLLRHYDKGPCKNKLGHSRASVVWHRAQVIGIFAGFGILLLVASPLLLLAAPCIVCCKCRICSGAAKLEENDTDLEDPITLQR
ncbi:uncharacterized protein LOC134831203 [Culicoides brevitarsis]|uniref:uncharacterized protein LOC134831203 n=1 Tax=Culicoides brevitarsis TaxID=469753 RepID=UPI00307B3FA0